MADGGLQTAEIARAFLVQAATMTRRITRAKRQVLASDNPVVRLNHAVAVAMAQGPVAGLELLAELESAGKLRHDHRMSAVRAHLLELVGDLDAAREHYLAAAAATPSLPQQRYLYGRAAALIAPTG